MPRCVSIAQARNHLTLILQEVERGESVELTRRGTPIAAIVPISEYRRLLRQTPGFWRALTVFREGMKPADL